MTARHVIKVDMLWPRVNGRHFADDTLKRIFMNENVRISINISLKFVPNGLMNNIPALVQIMAWRRPGDKPLSEPMMVNLLTHICVTRPQWVNMLWPRQDGIHIANDISNAFPLMKIDVVWLKYPLVYPERSNWHQDSVGSAHGFMSSK